MRELKQETKDMLRAHIDRCLAMPDKEACALSLYKLFVESLERADCYATIDGANFYEPITESNYKLTAAKKVMYDR